MRPRLASLFALCWAFAGLTAAFPVPPGIPAPRPGDAPIIVLPPDERQPLVLSMAQAEATDVADWSHDDVNTKEAWKTTEGEGQVVAVLDTGAYLQHRDLEGQVVGTADETGEGVNDVSSHGTWCATHIVAARNGFGMLGHMPKSKVFVVKVLAGRQGAGSVVWIANGIRRAVDWRGPNGERVSVISLSLGGSGTDSYIPPAIAYAKSKGVIVVAAAGNAGPREGTVGYPGGYPDVVCVAAHDQKGVTASFSSRGPAVFVSGPGVNTRAGVPGGPANPDGLFGTMSGTSMSCPVIAAMALGWCSVKGGEFDSTRGERFRNDLKAACPATFGRNTQVGWGKPDFGKLVAGGTVTPPPPPKLDAIRFEVGDFTPSGLEKLKLLNPKLDGLVFPLKP